VTAIAGISTPASPPKGVPDFKIDRLDACVEARIPLKRY
jgi:hypothetical protein